MKVDYNPDSKWHIIGVIIIMKLLPALGFDAATLMESMELSLSITQILCLIV
jgi:hypothetical protein